MPNWVEGKLKIRGKLEDIRRWVEECLHCYTTNTTPTAKKCTCM